MPLHDVGYRGWQGAKNSMFMRWWVIATIGVQLAFRTSWLSRTLVVSWIPAIALGFGFFLYEQSILQPELRRGVAGMMMTAGASPEMVVAFTDDPSESRHAVWSSLLLLFFRYPQAILMLIVVAIVAPKLVSTDLRNKGYLLYFSRPINVWEYVFGKSLVVCFFLALITTAPAIMLFLVGLSLSPDLTVISDTWDLPLRIFVASFVLMVPVTSVALACSAMTIESRYAAFSWFAVWVIGWVSYSVLLAGETAMQITNAPQPSGPIRLAGLSEMRSRWEIISPYHVLGRVQQWVFGLLPEDVSGWPYLAVLFTVSVVCLWFVHRKLRSRLQS